MAKANFSPLGQWRGKSGGQVYRIRNGVQIVSNYQPQVSNPRSEGQLIQRAKFNLVTGFNRITPIEVLRGYAGTPAKKRAMFAKELSKYISAELVSDKYVATIDPRNIHFDTIIPTYLTSVISDVSITDDGTLPQVYVAWTGSEFQLEGSILRIIDVYGPSGAPVSVNFVDVENPETGGGQTFDGTGRHRIFFQVLVPSASLRSVDGKRPHNQQLVNVPITADLEGSEAGNYVCGHAVYIGSHVVPAREG